MPELTSERLSTEFVSVAEQERQGIARRVEVLRERAAELHEQADALEQEANVHQRVLRELEDVLGIAAQLRLDLPQGGLGGRRLREVAVDVLRQHHSSEPIHYTEWYELVRAAGHRVAGKDPIATFLAQVSRDPKVERIGRKSGRYRLRHAAATSNGRPVSREARARSS